MRASLTEAMMRKDAVAAETWLREANVTPRERNKLLELTQLYGDPNVLTHAKKLFETGPIYDALLELDSVVSRCGSSDFSGSITVDLGEVRRQSYYTGVSSTLLASGPGEPIGRGGRYDQLLARYGSKHAATGFAFDVDNLSWALHTQNRNALNETSKNSTMKR